MKAANSITEAVSLFGTCGGSTWRQPYCEALRLQGIPFFDPQIMTETHNREWCEGDIENELRHLTYDPVLMFKVTGETTGLLSMLEITRAIQKPTQFIVVCIDDMFADAKEFSGDPRLQAMAAMLAESGMKVPNILKDASRTRDWVRQNLLESPSPLIQLADDDDMALKFIVTAWSFTVLHNPQFAAKS